MGVGDLVAYDFRSFATKVVTKQVMLMNTA